MFFFFSSKGVTFDVGYSFAPHAKTNPLPAVQRVPVVAGAVIAHVCVLFFFFFCGLVSIPVALQLRQHFGRLCRHRSGRLRSAVCPHVSMQVCDRAPRAVNTEQGRTTTQSHTHTRVMSPQVPRSRRDSGGKSVDSEGGGRVAAEVISSAVIYFYFYFSILHADAFWWGWGKEKNQKEPNPRMIKGRWGPGRVTSGC